MIAIIQGCGNNLSSVTYAVQRLGYEPVLTQDPAILQRADRLLLPGVGHARAAMHQLRGAGLDRLIPRLSQPLLGICLGMQLLYETSAEGGVECLGLLAGRVEPLQPDENLPLPHMGWNRLQWLDGESECHTQGRHVYYVHSYAAPVTEDTLAATDYGQRFSAVVKRGHVHGMQFHPEKSDSAGAYLLQQFLENGTL